VPDFGAEGCGKIDVLYVIEQGMPEDYRSRVQDGIAFFNERLVETFENIELHMLVTTDAVEWPGDVCADQCDQEGHCDASGDPNFSCQDLNNVHPCEKKLGGGHTFPIGPGAANQRCVGTNSQFLRSTTPDLLDTLNCTTQVGGAFPGVWHTLTSNAMLSAVIGGGPDACNQDFFRDDAPLIVIYISQWAEGDYPPEFWAQTLFDAKGGSSDAVGVIGIISDNSTENPICQPPLPPDFGSETIEFLREHVPHHVFGSICADDLNPYFDEGINLIQTLCEQYVPQ